MQAVWCPRDKKAFCNKERDTHQHEATAVLGSCAIGVYGSHGIPTRLNNTGAAHTAHTARQTASQKKERVLTTEWQQDDTCGPQAAEIRPTDASYDTQKPANVCGN